MSAAFMIIGGFAFCVVWVVGLYFMPKWFDDFIDKYLPKGGKKSWLS